MIFSMTNYINYYFSNLFKLLFLLSHKTCLSIELFQNTSRYFIVLSTINIVYDNISAKQFEIKFEKKVRKFQDVYSTLSSSFMKLKIKQKIIHTF